MFKKTSTLTKKQIKPYKDKQTKKPHQNPKQKQNTTPHKTETKQKKPHKTQLGDI